jgi:hypothetical protein
VNERETSEECVATRESEAVVRQLCGLKAPEILCRYGPLTCDGVPIVVGQFWAGDTRCGTC